ncbi:MAG TPA: cyclophilin-like fold protein [Thermodesulfovibrionales bacterium]|nr:cyclophilin-like fold protein [Thermodesulfovibrionales bacterium]
MNRIRLTIRGIVLEADLFDTKTARAVFGVLPIEAAPEEWGDEFYFEIGVEMPLDETASTKVKVGDIGYWPPGNSLAIFFGPTPISRGEDPVPASEVNIVGRVVGDATILKRARGAGKIRIEAA